MSKNLFIVESPAKCGKIEQYLGLGNKCIASYGHFRELNGLQSINIHNNFEPTFTISESKQTQVNKIRKCIKESTEVFLATDDDREGEAIAWHLCQYFGLSITTTKRIVFHEVTESALQRSVKEYRYVNMNIVNAQLARQVLDLLVGYKLSPILWKNVKDGVSAGRCQTPALRLLYDNYKEIQESPGSKEYNTTGYFTSKNIPFVLNYNFTGDDINAFLKESIVFEHIYGFGALRDISKSPPEPLTTSKLQQVASNKLHTSPKETMKICQKLYEEGHITYMRTDSSVYSQEFIEKTIVFIYKEYGEDYVSSDIKILTAGFEECSAKKDKIKAASGDINLLVQAAHEAIRPTNINTIMLDEIQFSSKETKMYQLIRSITLESCMKHALYKGVTATITAPQEHNYKFSAEQVIFPGWKIVNGVEEVDKEFAYLQAIKQQSIIKYNKITAKHSLKELKTHYTEAKLVQLLEQRGIGRPSTFSSLIDKVQERGYAKKENVNGVFVKCIDYEVNGKKINTLVNEREFGNEKNKLVIKQLGVMVLEYLVLHFNNLFAYDYTRHMEEQLDEIARGNKCWHDLCKECLNDIDLSIKRIDEKHRGKETIRVDNEHVYMMGKYGPVLKCTNDSKNDTFKAVNQDIDLDKLRNGEYTLDQITVDSTCEKNGRLLGLYKTKEVALKSGKFGWYIEWNSERKSLKLTLEEANALTLDDASETLFNIENGDASIIRTISKETSIRKGKYGDYIFHKNKKMKKPKFLKLNEFKDDYNTCDIETINTWLKKTYDINTP
jgi:DNA topoisomerase-1